MIIRVVSALVAAALVILSAGLPLWRMTLRAPQYPAGLQLTAYGSGIDGDLREINIINHYIGMAPLDPRPALEVSLFPVGIGLLVALCLLAPFHRRLRHVAVAAAVVTPVGILIDLQWWMYRYGHSLDPTAPIRLEPFTPLALGTSTIGNFVTSGRAASGMLCYVAAALVLVAGERLARRRGSSAVHVGTARPIAAALAPLFLAALPAAAAGPSGESLQARLDRTPAGSTVVVDGGVHGPIVIRGPLTVVGRNQPVVDGAGRGSVVTIEGDAVVFRGFVVRNSGRQVTEEAAGIKATGNRHRIEENDVHDVYFGIHLAGGEGHAVRRNRIVPGERHGARPGHGISLWNVSGSRLVDNRIAEARDGIYLSFTDGVLVSGNEISQCRYGLHSMFSRSATLAGNVLAANLLGASLMNSDRLVFSGNRVERHREGSAAYGVLLKDIGALVAEGNVIAGNRIGVYAEGVPTSRSQQAVLTGNVIAGNGVGLALQSNAALTMTGNRIADNLADVRPLGRGLSPDSRWSVDGRGNSWSEYRGYDADGDGIGDLPHRAESVMDDLVRRNPLVQAFLYTPAHLALEAAARMFPLARRDPVLVDSHPLARTGAARIPAATLPVAAGVPGGTR